LPHASSGRHRNLEAVNGLLIPLRMQRRATRVSQDEATDMDVQRVAWEMICRYGEHAAVEAAVRGDRLLDCDDRDGHLIRKAIVSTIKRLQATKPAAGETVH
jgi:hypothetical protein